MPSEWYEQLQRLAAESGRTVEDVLEEALDEFVQSNALTSSK